MEPTFQPSSQEITVTQTTQADYDNDFLTLKDYLPLTWKGIMIPCGLFLNLLSLYVFIRSKTLRKMSSTLYLMALAVADSSVLLGE